MLSSGRENLSRKTDTFVPLRRTRWLCSTTLMELCIGSSVHPTGIHRCCDVSTGKMCSEDIVKNGSLETGFSTKKILFHSALRYLMFSRRWLKISLLECAPLLSGRSHTPKMEAECSSEMSIMIRSNFPEDSNLHSVLSMHEFLAPSILPRFIPVRLLLFPKLNLVRSKKKKLMALWRWKRNYTCWVPNS
jgi:hypothetical protein